MAKFGRICMNCGLFSKLDLITSKHQTYRKMDMGLVCVFHSSLHSLFQTFPIKTYI